MNAVIDIGNTRSKFGLFTGPDDGLEVSYLKTEEILAFLASNVVEKVLISNVADSNAVVGKIRESVRELLVLSIKTPLPIRTSYKTPETLGVDRLAACVGARKIKSGNILVIDAGSCITYDLLTKENVHKGGIISPGIEMRLKAMHTFTSNLPLVPVKAVPLEGESTEHCLQSGAINGVLAEMKGIIQEYLVRYEDLSVIIGGGDAEFFDKNLELDTFVVSNLVLEGLRAIFVYNE